MLLSSYLSVSHSSILTSFCFLHVHVYSICLSGTTTFCFVRCFFISSSLSLSLSHTLTLIFKSWPCAASTISVSLLSPVVLEAWLTVWPDLATFWRFGQQIFFQNWPKSLGKLGKASRLKWKSVLATLWVTFRKIRLLNSSNIESHWLSPSPTAAVASSFPGSVTGFGEILPL